MIKPTQCKNPPCQNTFTPARKWQHFCSVKCRNDFHNQERLRKIAAMEQELEELRNRNKEVQREKKNNTK